MHMNVLYVLENYKWQLLRFIILFEFLNVDWGRRSKKAWGQIWADQIESAGSERGLFSQRPKFAGAAALPGGLQLVWQGHQHAA